MVRLLPICFLIALSCAALEAYADQGQDRIDTAESALLSDLLNAVSDYYDVVIVGPSELISSRRAERIQPTGALSRDLETVLAPLDLDFNETATGAIVIRAKPISDIPGSTREEPTTPPTPPRSHVPVKPKPEHPMYLDRVLTQGTQSRGLQRSLDVKRAAPSITDAIVASEIGKLPAANAAEALQRAPGVSLVREAGEGQFISVRGLGPNFQTVTLNGAPLAYNENIRNSGQSGRQFRFRVLPADLMEALVIVKAPTADLIEGGIGSTIDIRQSSPLAQKSFVSSELSISLDERTNETTPMGNVVGSWSNERGNFGLGGGISFQKRQTQFDRFQTFGYDRYSVAGQDVLVAGSYQTTLEEEDRERLGLLGRLQAYPTDWLKLEADLLYSRFTNAITENRVGYQFGSLSETNLVPGTERIQQGVLYAGTIEGGQITRNLETSEQTHDNFVVSVGGEIDYRDWTFSPRVSWSGALSELTRPLQRIDGLTVSPTGVNYRFDLGRAPVSDRSIAALVSTLDLTAPGAVPFRRYRIRPIESEDRHRFFSLEAQRPIDWTIGKLEGTEFRVGLQRSDRLRDYQRRDRELVLRDGFSIDESYYSEPVSSNAFDQTIRMRSRWVGADFNRFARAFTVGTAYDGVDPNVDDLPPTATDLQNSYRVEEGTHAAYARLDFETLFLGKPASGNVGLRYVATETETLGAVIQQVDEGTIDGVPVTQLRRTRSQSDFFLPSFNLALELSPDLLVRASAAHSMTPPSLADLRDSLVPNSATVSAIFENGSAALDDDLNLNAVGGNPRLKPYSSTNIDLALEWYSPSFGGVAATLFYKDISDFVVNTPLEETATFSVRDGSSLQLPLLVNRPRNIGALKITGIEFSGSAKTPLGLGFAASATVLDSDLDLPQEVGVLNSVSIQGVSDFSGSITTFYERGLLEAYLSYTYRSEFNTDGGVSVGTTPATSAEMTVFADEQYILDGGISFNVNQNFRLFAEAANILDERQAAYIGTTATPYQIHRFGRTLNIGTRVRF